MSDTPEKPTTKTVKYKLERIRTAEFNQLNVDLINNAFESISDVTGPDGPQGIQGKPGDPGKDGLDGADGVDGAEGVQGPRGYTGLTGKDGEKGDTGEKGKDSYVEGPIGETGPEGPIGEVGPKGGSEDIKFRVISFDLLLPQGNLADGEMTVNSEECDETTIVIFGERDSQNASSPPLDVGDMVEIGPARYRVMAPESTPNSYSIEHITGGELWTLDLLEKVVYLPVDNQVHENLQNQIDELSETKGAIAQYQVHNIVNGVATRAGELATNAAQAEDVTWISLASVDSNGNVTKAVSDQDIIEVGYSRFVVTDSTAQPSSMVVMYVSGDQEFVITESLDLYVFPQNAESASIDYVNSQDQILSESIDQKLDSNSGEATGGLTLEGDLNINTGLIYIDGKLFEGGSGSGEGGGTGDVTQAQLDEEIFDRIAADAELEDYVNDTTLVQTGLGSYDKPVYKAQTNSSSFSLYGPETDNNVPILAVNQCDPDGKAKAVFRVRNDGHVQIGEDSNHPFIAVYPHDVVTKQYHDLNPGNIPLATSDIRGIDYRGQAAVGTNDNPSLKTGQLYYNSNTKKLIVGT